MPIDAIHNVTSEANLSAKCIKNQTSFRSPFELKMSQVQEAYAHYIMVEPENQ